MRTHRRTPLRRQIVDPSIAAFLTGKATITDDEFARDFFGRDWEHPARGVRTSLANILHLAGYQRATVERDDRFIPGWCLRPITIEQADPEPKRANKHRERRATPEEWDVPVAELLKDRAECTSSEVLALLGVEEITREKQLRLAGVLHRLGWVADIRWDKGAKRAMRLWVRRPAPPVEKSASPG